jgi:hypothetical protein
MLTVKTQSPIRAQSGSGDKIDQRRAGSKGVLTGEVR